jgi:hypothetical protein
MCWFSGENEAANLKTIFLIANYYWVNFLCALLVLSRCCLGIVWVFCVGMSCHIIFVDDLKMWYGLGFSKKMVYLPIVNL